ncbi:MAG TPA: VWA domain-containing protein [Burkholderiales bacterium]|nr:VWA domain-containing protein [Burkholderiales bacterium]
MIEFLRPGWLLALAPALALLWAWWRARSGAAPWRRLVDPELLAVLAQRAPATSARSALGIAAALLVLACVALAGPSWRVRPAPQVRDLSARVVVLDLSPSMDAIDAAPSRIARARAAVADILRDSGHAQLGLVVFGADAFMVAPLVNDPAALVHLLKGLDTATVPRAGSRPDLGLDMARALLERGGIAAGDVILVGDSAGDARTLQAARALASEGFPLSVLAVGTPEGGPVRLVDGALARSDRGEILVTKPEFAALERVARSGGGRFRLLTPHGRTPRFARGEQAWTVAPAAISRSAKLRLDDGIWFVLLALPLAALLFRRGWLMGLAAFALSFALSPPQAQAFGWHDLWRRTDQQAAAAFAARGSGERAEVLSRLGPRSPWRALLLYRSGRYAQAAALFAASDTADAHYNRGNALALEGRLEAAIAAYSAALERSPSMRDALFNRALVLKALARRREQAQGSARTQAPQGPGASPSAAPQRHARAEGRSSRGPAPRSGEAGEPSETARRSARERDRSGLAQPPGTGARPQNARETAERRRLERLLAAVPDDPGALLANRFERELQLRGDWHHDKGEPW